MEHIEKCKEKEIKVSKEVRPWDMINGSPKVSAELVKQRLDICHECPCVQTINPKMQKIWMFYEYEDSVRKGILSFG
jgi:hypothetical protein